MADTLPPTALPKPVAPPAAAVPLPRRPLEQGERGLRGTCGLRDCRDCRDAWIRFWYENELEWPTVPGSPVRLAVGMRFDVLDVPVEAGRAALRHLAPGSPVALQGDRMRLLVAAGSAEELPGLLEWLEWGPVALDLAAIGAGGVMTAPLPPGPVGVGSGGAVGSQGAAVWMRPPEPGCEVEASLPTLSALGGGGGAPELVRLVDTVAAQCHRVRLRRACTRPPARSS